MKPLPKLIPSRTSAKPSPGGPARFVRFLAVGVLNTVFGYGVFALVWVLSQEHLVAVVIANLAGMTFNYFTIGRLVFANRGFRALAPFVAGYGLVLALNLCLMEGLIRMGVAALAAQLIAMPVLVLASYAFNSLVVFRKAAGGAGRP